MPNTKQLMNAVAIQRALARIAHEVAESQESGQDVAVLGIQSGGVVLAERLAKELTKIWGSPVPVGQLDISMHRDDLDQRLTPTVHPTNIPFDVNGKVIVLVDDVLFTGRTIRAAMDALHDLGRPKLIRLAVLADRGHRALPIKADYVGKNIPTSLSERLNLKLKEQGHDHDALELAQT